MRIIHSVDAGKVIQEIMAAGKGLEAAKQKVVALRRASVKPLIKEHREKDPDVLAAMLGTRA